MRNFRIGTVVLAAAAVLLLIVPAPSQRSEEQRIRPLRPVVRGTRGAVAGGTPLVTEAGMRMYHSGGNAVDAGVAALFAGSVVEYSHYGFAGEAPILIRTRDGKVHSIAGVGTAPKLATAEFFRNRRPTPDELATARSQGDREGPIPSSGLLCALVPGMVDAALTALQHFGTKSFAEVVQPAIELADGAPIDETRSNSIARAVRFFQRWPASQKVFLPGGQPPRPGDIFRQPDLARTLRAMVAAEKATRAKGDRTAGIQAVRDYFYRGEVARKIDTFSKDNGGLLRYEDMAAFRLEPEEPLHTTYRGYEVYKNGFWTQGAVLLETLNLLERYDLAALRLNSADYLHILAEALKLAYADRDSYYADPKFVQPPTELLTKSYAAQRARLIDPAAASPEFRPGEIALRPPVHPSHYPGPKAGQLVAANDTTCLNAMDRDGMVFTSTPSGAWLPSVIAGDTGVPLTQRAQSFLLIAGHPNVLEPGKRPRITLSPTLVTRGGQPFMALSTPGGDNQDQSLLQVLLAVVEFGFNPQIAVEAPRIQTRHLVSSFDVHAMYPNSLLVDERISEPTFRELAARGHKVERRPAWQNGAAPTAIRFLAETGVLEAGADPYGMRYADAW
jgi:gamma-glutamyltranspeptidase/glutathione hydrolase